MYLAKAKGACRVRAFEFSVADTHVLEFGVNYLRVFSDGVQEVITKASVTHWVTATAYSVNDIRQDDPSDAYYYCAEAHTSGTFATDLAAGKWVVMTDAADTDNLIYEIYTPFDTIAEIFAFHSTQSADVMYIASDSVYPQKISRLGDAEWTIEDVPFTCGPFLDENTDDDDVLVFTHTADETGTHDGLDNAITVTDTSKTWVVNEHAGKTIVNTHIGVGTEKGCYGIVLSNTPTVITITGDGLANSVTTNDFDIGDTFTILDLSDEHGFYHEAGSTGVLTATGGHEPFNASHVGSLWQITATRLGDNYATLIGIDVPGTTSMVIEIFGNFSVDGVGFNGAAPLTITLQRKQGNGEWQDFRKFTSAFAYTASEDEEDVFYRLVASGTATVDTNVILTAQDQISNGVVEVTSYNSTTSVDTIIIEDIFSDTIPDIEPTSLRYGNGSDVMVTLIAHGRSNGDRLVIKNISRSDFSGLNYDTETNNIYVVTGVTADTFRLASSDANVTGNASATTAGIGEYYVLGTTTTTSMWSEGAWSTFRGFPRVLTFHEDRLWFGGTTNNPQTVWSSKTADYENFAAGVFANNAVTFALNVNDVSQIQWLESRDWLIVGTADAEFIMGAANPDNAITPEDVKLRNQSAYGSSGIQPVILNDAVFYVQRSKRRLRAMIFDLQSASLRSFDANRLHNTILESPPVDIAAQKTTEGAIYLIKEDGSLAVFVYEPLEEVAGWSRAVTGRLSQSGLFPVDGEFQSVCVTSGDSEDTITFCIKRTINSSTVYYIEKFATRTTTSLDESVLLDSAAQVASGSDVQQIVCASDTVRCNSGNCNSGPCGGVLS